MLTIHHSNNGEIHKVASKKYHPQFPPLQINITADIFFFFSTVQHADIFLSVYSNRMANPLLSASKLILKPCSVIKHHKRYFSYLFFPSLLKFMLCLLRVELFSSLTSLPPPSSFFLPYFLHPCTNSVVIVYQELYPGGETQTPENNYKILMVL